MSLEIRVLGPLDVRVDGEKLRVDTRKATAILALLAVEGRPYARDELAALFWPESDDDSARSALRRTLSVLRAALRGRWLSVDRSAVALGGADDGVWTDIGALDEAAMRADPDSLAEAAALARGPFLAGFSLRDSPEFDDWRATRAVTVERRLVDVLERLTGAAEAAGDWTAAVAAATRLVELDPLDEPARRRLMAALARGGDRAGAVRQYRATVAVLERELGVAPLAETTELYEAIRDERFGPAGRPPPSPAPPRRPAPSAMDPTAIVPVQPDPGAAALPMVGREGPLAVLLDAYRAASPGGRVVSITGEAGIGKSRLAEGLAASTAADGAAVLTARTFPAEGSIAYAPVVELLRVGLGRPDAAARLAALPATTLGELGRLVALPDGLGPASVPSAADSPAGQARLLEGLAAGLAALVHGPAPGLLVVEDVQWADEASREALLYLARRLGGRSLLLVLTWRTDDLDASGAAFAGSIEAVAGAVTVPLGRLEPGDVAQLVSAAAASGLPVRDAQALAAESEGLPLYVVEALVAGPAVAGSPPRGVRALLRERLATVGETAGQVLAAAAVIGRSFDFDAVRGASGRSEEETVDALETLVRRGIVREVASGGGPAFDFSHARLRDAAYEEVGLARRRLLHRRVAEVLRSDGVGREDPGRLAQIAGHELGAGRDAAAAEAYREAGLGARRVYANREALEHLQAALALGHPDAAELQIAIGEVRTALGDYAGAVASFEAAAALVPEPDLAGMELRLGRVHARRGDVATAASHLDAALLVAPPSLRAIVLVERGVVALRAGDLQLAGALVDEALASGAGAIDPRLTGAGNRLAGLVALRRGDLEVARRALQTALEASAATADEDPGASIAARNGLALVEAAAGDRPTAIALLEDALAECRRTGETHLEAAVENNLADQLHAAGRTDESMAHLKRAVTLFAEVGGGPGAPEPEIWKLVSW